MIVRCYRVTFIFCICFIQLSFPDFVKEFGFGGSYSDNLNASIETRSPLSALQERTGLLNGGLGYTWNYGKRNYLYSIYRLNFAHHQNFTDSRMREQSIYFQLNNNFSKITTLNISTEIKSDNFYQNDILNFYNANANLFLRQYLVYNLILELEYGFIKTDFYNVDRNNVVAYSLISKLGNSFKGKLKYWVFPTVRLSTQFLMSLVPYKSTSSPYLIDLSRLSAGEKRKDIFSAGKIDAAYVLPISDILLDVGYVLELNKSNSSYYRYTSNNVVFDIIWNIGERQQFLSQMKYGLYDYYDRQFDTRYQNTREDVRLYFTFSHSYRLTGNLRMITRYGLISNDSNDSIDFNSVTSRSYASFNKNDISTTLNFTY